MDKRKPLRGVPRARAMDDLKTSLFDEVSSIGGHVDIESEFVQSLMEHDNPEQWAIYERLFGPLILAEQPFESDLYSPTPGDPRRTYLRDGTPYEEASLAYMMARFKQVVDASKTPIIGTSRLDPASNGVQPKNVEAIQFEIKHQHELEIEKNDAAMHRLRQKFMNDPKSIQIDEADLIEKVRGVSAKTEERLELLLLHPEIDAIEDMKFTSALNYIEYVDAKSAYFDRLAQLNTLERFVVRFIGTDNQHLRPRDLTDEAPEGVSANKMVVAEIFDTQTGKVVEVVEKLNEYDFPEQQRLRGLVPHVVEGVNRLPAYTQMVLRIQRDRLSEDDARRQELRYNLQNMVIVKDAKRRHIEEL